MTAGATTADTTQPKPWARPAKQDRSRRSFERVLDAAAALLGEGGWEAFSVTEVCRRASVSPGSLYGRVSGKDELFLALHERELGRMSAHARELFADGPQWRALTGHDHVQLTVRTLGRHLVDQAALLRPFILRAAVDPRIAAQGRASVELVEQAVTARLLDRAADYPHPCAEAAVRTAYRLAADTFRWQIAFGAPFTPGADAATTVYRTWVEQVASVCAAYLTTPPT